MLQLDSGSQSCFRLQNNFTDIPSVVLVTARGALLPGHAHIACLCLLAADVAAGEECLKDREMAKGRAVSSWLLNTEQCPCLSKSRKKPFKSLYIYIYKEYNWQHPEQRKMIHQPGNRRGLCKVRIWYPVTSCHQMWWYSRGEYTIINHTPRSQIRHQEKMVLLTQEKTSQVLKYGILL